MAATKADKLTASKRSRARRELLDGFGEGGVADGPLLVSAETGLGVRELWKCLDNALEQSSERELSNRH